jgi:methyl-accepting chemotaxis protein
MRIVNINEEIKKVAACAFRINIVALNAIVLAAQAGEAALGFGQVSIELRAFSSSLGACMADVSQRTYASVGAVTSLLKSSRLHHILRRAADDGDGGRNLAPAVHRAGSDLEGCSQHLAAQRERLAREVAQASRLSELGQALSRNARIEAAYGGEFAAPLAHLTDEFSDVIGHVAKSLRLVGELTERQPV